MTTTSPPADTQIITPHFVTTLARFADLPLAEARCEAVCAVLESWIGDANALSLKMSAPEHQALVPATVFTHPAVSNEET